MTWQVDLVSCFIARCRFQNRRHPKEIGLLEPNYRSVGRSTGSQKRTWPHDHGTNLLLTGEENLADLKTMNLNEGFSFAHGLDKIYMPTMWLIRIINSKVPRLEKWASQGTTRSSPHDLDEDDPLKRFLIFKIDNGFQSHHVR